MSHPYPDPLVHTRTSWLLTPPSPPLPRPHLSDQEVGVLELFATITGAPSAIPPDLWHSPVLPQSFPEVRALLKQICTALAERIPFLHWDFLEWEEDAVVLSHFLQIPVEPVGIDGCNGEVFGYGGVLSWVATLCGYLADEVPYPLPEEMPVGFEVFDLSPFLAKYYEGQPLAGLADIIEMLNHTTDTFFLDACPACWHSNAEDFTDWTDENLEWLEQDALRTSTILARVDALEAWVRTDPARIDVVWQALLEAHTTLQVQEAQARPQTLLEVWELHLHVDNPEGETIEGILPL
jgi:hypothetical protein